MAEDIWPILQALKCEIQLSHQVSLADFKGEIATLHQYLSRDIEVLRMETITNSQKSQHDLVREIGKTATRP